MGPRIKAVTMQVSRSDQNFYFKFKVEQGIGFANALMGVTRVRENQMTSNSLFRKQ